MAVRFVKHSSRKLFDRFRMLIRELACSPRLELLASTITAWRLSKIYLRPGKFIGLDGWTTRSPSYTPPPSLTILTPRSKGDGPLWPWPEPVPVSHPVVMHNNNCLLQDSIPNRGDTAACRAWHRRCLYLLNFCRWQRAQWEEGGKGKAVAREEWCWLTTPVPTAGSQAGYYRNVKGSWAGRWLVRLFW